MLAPLHKITLVAILCSVIGCERSAKDPDVSVAKQGGDAPEPMAAATLSEPAKLEPPTPVVSPEIAAAIEAFQKQALAALPKEMEPGLRAFAVQAIQDREHLGAQRKSGRACFERIDGTLSAKERESLLLFGKIEDMRDYPGDCWDVLSFGGFGNSINGYLDAKTNKLLLLWIVPEG
jgi:hypothetical protein